MGLFLGVFPLWSAFVVSIIGGLGLQKLRSSTKISGDSAVAVVLVSGLAVGVILTSASGGFSVDLFSFLFGSILLVSTSDVILIAAISAGIVAVLFAFRRPFLHISFNEEHARISGLNVTLLNYLFVVLASVTVVTSMRLVGILLISALIVIPNITAMLFGMGFKRTVGISVSMSVFSAAFGIILSYYLDIAPSRNHSDDYRGHPSWDACMPLPGTDIKGADPGALKDIPQLIAALHESRACLFWCGRY